MDAPNSKEVYDQGQHEMTSGDNPFNSPEYQNVDAPDRPIQYGGGMADILLNNEQVPKSIRKEYWHVFNNDNVLTFLDEPRKEMKLVAFDVSTLDSINSLESYEDYGFEMEKEIGLVRNALDVKLDRAVGSKTANVKNERTVLQSQFTEARNVNEQGGGGDIKQGFFKRLLGRR